MEITGVQAVGARSLGSVSATVTNSSPAAPTVGGVGDAEHAAVGPRELHPEAVVFPRDGKPLDQRPVELRHQRATARYREDGRPRSRRERA
jgi:hypothetical protein